MGSLQKTDHIVRYAMVEAGIHRYLVGTETPRLLATSRGGSPLASSFLADLILRTLHPINAIFAWISKRPAPGLSLIGSRCGEMFH